MAKERKTIGIFPRILLTMLIVTLIPLAGLWFINAKALQDWQNNLQLRMAQTSATLASQVDNWLDKNLRALKNNALLPDITSMETDRHTPVLKAMLKTYEWSYLTFSVGPDGLNVGRSDGKAPKQYGDREYVKQVLAGKPHGSQVLMGRTSGKPALVISTPIHAPGTERILGVLALASHLVDISEAVAKVRIGKTGHALLLDEKGRLIAHGQPQRITALLQDLSDHPAFKDSANGKQIVYENNGKQVVAYSRKIRDGWTLIIEQNYNEAFAPLTEAEYGAKLLLAATVVLVLLAAWLMGRLLAAPIRRLTDIADRMSCGDLDVEIRETQRGDEIGALARAIDRMGVSIRMAMQKLHKAAA